MWKSVAWTSFLCIFVKIGYVYMVFRFRQKQMTIFENFAKLKLYFWFSNFAAVEKLFDAAE